MNIRDTNYARYITLSAVILLVVIATVWLFKLFNKHTQITDPREGVVCMDTQCVVKKECDGPTLLIKTALSPNATPTVQRVPNSTECQS